MTSVTSLSVSPTWNNSSRANGRGYPHWSHFDYSPRFRLGKKNKQPTRFAGTDFKSGKLLKTVFECAEYTLGTPCLLPPTENVAKGTIGTAYAECVHISKNPSFRLGYGRQWESCFGYFRNRSRYFTNTLE